MDTLLWIVQGLGVLLYGASGVMKVFLFEKVSHDVPSFGALPRRAWTALGILELACVIGLLLPMALRGQSQWTVLAATLLAVESLVFLWVHSRVREIGPLLFSGALGLLMAFLAYGRAFLVPLP